MFLTIPTLARCVRHRRSAWLLHVCLTALVLLAPIGSAAALEVDILAQLREARAAFVALHQTLAESEERYSATSTTGNRMRRDTAQAALEFARLSEVALAEELVATDVINTAWDDIVTARQIAASLLLEVGECTESELMLGVLLQHPEVVVRPLVYEAASRRHREALECVAEAERAAAVAAVVETPPGRQTNEPVRGLPTETWLYTSIGAGAASVVGAGFTISASVRSAHHSNAARSELEAPVRSVDVYERSRRDALDAQRRATIALALTSVAAIAAAGSAIVYVRHRARERGAEEPRRRAVIAPAAFGASFAYTW